MLYPSLFSWIGPSLPLGTTRQLVYQRLRKILNYESSISFEWKNADIVQSYIKRTSDLTLAIARYITTKTAAVKDSKEWKF